MGADIAVIIPAYNEEHNIPILLTRILRIFPQARVIIVDDSRERRHVYLKKVLGQRGFLRVELLWRGRKLGRGSAVIAGLRRAYADRKISYFFEMDADLSHDPADLGSFIAPLQRGADLVIGSRYIHKDSILDWPLYRLILSRIINVSLNRWLGLSLSDYTNGYRLYSRRAIGHILAHPPRETGFIVLSETAYILNRAGFTITEIPTTFTDRTHGKSNAGIKELLLAIIGAIRIKHRS